MSGAPDPGATVTVHAGMVDPESGKITTALQVSAIFEMANPDTILLAFHCEDMPEDKVWCLPRNVFREGTVQTTEAEVGGMVRLVPDEETDTLELTLSDGTIFSTFTLPLDALAHFVETTYGLVDEEDEEKEEEIDDAVAAFAKELEDVSPADFQ